MSRNRYLPATGIQLARVRAALRVRWNRWRSRSRVPGLRKSNPAGETGSGTPSLAGKFCPAPFMQVDLEESGTCYTCCSSWLPTPMGNVSSIPLETLWNGPTMQKIRASIYDGSYRYCRHDRCPRIQNGDLPTLKEAEENSHFGAAVKARETILENLPVTINMVNDRSCNLFCPSCRPQRIQITEGKSFDKMQSIQENFLHTWTGQPNQADFTLSITGSGDPFASRLYRELLTTLDGADFPNMKIALQTNGVLLTPRTWQRMNKVHDNISSVLISLDAATAETYVNTRRGGHWQTLMDNCRRLGDLRRNGQIKWLRYDFVVQKANFREMPAFIELARELGGDRAYLSRLVDWGTWPRDVFLDQCVWERGHEEEMDFLSMMASDALGNPFVDLGNMTEFRQKALRRGLASAASSTI